MRPRSTAVLDRLLQQAHVLGIEDRSYMLCEFKNAFKARSPSDTPPPLLDRVLRRAIGARWLGEDRLGRSTDKNKVALVRWGKGTAP